MTQRSNPHRAPWSLQRRRLLQACGLAAGSLFLPSLLSSRALAQAASPRRLVVFFTQHGTQYSNWRLRPNGQSDDVDFDVDLTALNENEFSQILAPLYAMRSKVTVLDGISLASAIGDELENQHDYGTMHALTGAFVKNGSAGAASFDQTIANAIALEGRVRSLELGVVGAKNGGAIFRAEGQPLPCESDPVATFRRLFPQGGNNTPDQPETGSRARVRQAQPRVLDFVASEYERLAPRLSREDRQKLELHRDLVRDVEARLNDLFLISCDAPQQAEVSGQFPSATHYQTRMRAMSTIAASALACDLTRVVSMQLFDLPSDLCGLPAGIDVHSEHAHAPDDSPGREVMTAYGRTHAQQFADLCALLDSIPEGNGTVLDNTLVVWCGELATGDHRFERWPVVIGGGGGLGLSTGRYLRFAPNQPTPSQHPTYTGVERLIGPSHNAMWLNLAERLGVSLDRVGEPELFTTEGIRLDCRTPLARL